jgi:hypothetical protein
MELRTASIADGLPALIIRKLDRGLTTLMITASIVRGKAISVIQQHLRDVDAEAAFGTTIELLLLGAICLRQVSLNQACAISIGYWRIS